MAVYKVRHFWDTVYYYYYYDDDDYNIYSVGQKTAHPYIWANYIFPTLQETQCNVINVTPLLRHGLLINMPFMSEDKLSIKLLHQEKGWGAKHICKVFLQQLGSQFC